MPYLLMLLSGAAFSGHCVGMCGLFPAALRTGADGGLRAALLQGAYHAGKISTYVFLGVLAAGAGLSLEGLQRPLGIVAGILLIVVGVGSFVPETAAPGLVRVLRGSPLCAVLGGLLRQARLVPALSVGVFNGFVPCGLVYAMAAHAATLGSIPAAALGMVCFGLGTVPALAAVGLSSGLLRRGVARSRWAPGLAIASALVTATLGVLTLLRTAGGGSAHLLHLG